MKYTMAPMEGIAPFLYRNVQERIFHGAQAYYAPFITTTEKDRIASRYLTDLLPSNNAVPLLIPQIMANDAAAFLRMAEKLRDMGYREINLNLGCPSGTVVKKGRGAGFLRQTDEMRRFFDTVFAVDRGYEVSVKTRIGAEDESEADGIFDVFRCYPICEVTVHPRLLSDGYKNDVRLETFAKALAVLKCPVQYNGDVRGVEDERRIASRFPAVSGVMIGRGALADPGIFRTLRGGKQTAVGEIALFTRTLTEEYLRTYRSRHTVLVKMKEVWTHLSESFENAERPFKRILKADTLEEMERLAQALMDESAFVPGRIRGIWE